MLEKVCFFIVLVTTCCLVRSTAQVNVQAQIHFDSQSQSLVIAEQNWKELLLTIHNLTERVSELESKLYPVYNDISSGVDKNSIHNLGAQEALLKQVSAYFIATKQLIKVFDIDDPDPVVSYTVGVEVDSTHNADILPLRFEVIGGALPEGLTLDPKTGVIEGSVTGTVHTTFPLEGDPIHSINIRAYSKYNVPSSNDVHVYFRWVRSSTLNAPPVIDTGGVTTYSAATQSSAQFGSVLAVSGNGIFQAYGCGTCHSLDPVSYAGAIFIKKFNGASWVFMQKLERLPNTASTFFGGAYGAMIFSSDGYDLIVGVPGADVDGYSNNGEVMHWRYDGTSSYSVVQTISGPAYHNAEYGTSIALSSDGSTLVVGEPGNDMGDIPGFLHVYEYSSSFTLVATIEAPNDQEEDFSGLGEAITMSGDGTLLVASLTGYENGCIFVYDLTTVTEEQRICSTYDPTWISTVKDIQISSDGSTIAVNGQSRAVHIFAFSISEDKFVYVQTLAGEGANLYEKSIAFSADASRLLIGDPGSTSATQGVLQKYTRTVDSNDGLPYYFAELSATIDGDTYNDGAAAGDFFSQSIAMPDDGSYFIVGVPRDDTTFTTGGNTYLFEN